MTQTAAKTSPLSQPKITSAGHKTQTARRKR